MTYNLLCPHEQLYSEVKSEKENRKWERQTIRRSKILERNGWSRSQINKSASDVLVFFRDFEERKFLTIVPVMYYTLLLQRCTVIAKKKAKKLQLGFLTISDMEIEHAHGFSTNGMKHWCQIYPMSLVSTLIVIAYPASCSFFIRRWKKCVW